MVSGLSPRAGWRKLVNAPSISLLVAVTFNLTGLSRFVPATVMSLVHGLAICAVPLGLLLTGVSIKPHLNDPGKQLQTWVTLVAWFLRLGVLPCLFLLAARFLPCSVELKRVLVVQAAMPSGSVRCWSQAVWRSAPHRCVPILGTTVLALFTIPLWIRFGMSFAGLAP